MSRRSALCAASALALAFASAGGVGAAEGVAAATAELRIEVALEPATASSREATFPDWSKGWGEAEVLQAGPVERTPAADGTHLVQRL